MFAILLYPVKSFVDLPFRTSDLTQHNSLLDSFPTQPNPRVNPNHDQLRSIG